MTYEEKCKLAARSMVEDSDDLYPNLKSVVQDKMVEVMRGRSEKEVSSDESN